MYVRPPLVVAATFNTNAVANTNTTHQILPSPGPNFAYRIVGIRTSVGIPSEPAANVFRIIFLANFVGFWGTIMQVGAVAGDGWAPPEPGIDNGLNNALQVASICTAVTRSFNVWVEYFIDQRT